MSHIRVADIAIDPRSGGSEAVYTYLAPADLEVGAACFVPLGNRLALGYATAVRGCDREALQVPLDRMKEPQALIENLSIPSTLIALAQYISDQYLCTLPVALSPAMPPNVRERLVTEWSLVGELHLDPELALNAAQREVIRVLQEQGGSLSEGSKKLPAASHRLLKLLQAKGVVRQTLRLSNPRAPKSSEDWIRLTTDASALEDFYRSQGKRKPAQALTLMCLQTAGEQTRFTLGEIKAMAGVTETTVKALLDAKLLERVDERSEALADPPMPNEFQQFAIDTIADRIERREFEPFLLHGVTGSGKTEVYLRAAAECLRLGRQVLYLVPEIALAAQAIAQLHGRFGRRATMLHSELSPGERLRNWISVRHGECPIVLGARSALFAPLEDIGLIVVDEEHEQTYKQESSPRYHAKRLAMFLARLHRCPIVLGSATPSAESFWEAEEKERGGDGLTLLNLPVRAASASLPTVHVEDLSEGYRSGQPAILSSALRDRMRATLVSGKQTIIFLNRRAYSPFIMCRDCGHQWPCPRCAVSMSFHRRDGLLRCHHCGFQTRPPDLCPACGGNRISPFGIGTEKVEESIGLEFPSARIGRLDRDVVQRKGALEEILASFRSGDLDVLVGTQMVAKGLDFPNVTLVGVIAADVSLNLPDFRAAERTYQLLAQVAGRAGRGKFAGEVVIQTFNPEHPSVLAAQRHDYHSMVERLLAERDEARYPPFVRLVNVVFSGEQRADVSAASTQVASDLSEFEVLGPVDCVLERLQGRWRRHLLIKLPRNSEPSNLRDALSAPLPKGVAMSIDVDAYSLM